MVVKMFSNYLISPEFLIFLIGISLICLYIYKKFGNYFTNKTSDQTITESTDNYSEKKIPTILLSAKEKLELSWKFLYDITEIVINKFSNNDKQEIIDNGSILYNSGMRYEHVVDYAVNYESQKLYEKKVMSSSKETDAPQGQSR
jgi:hypothetical protein